MATPPHGTGATATSARTRSGASAATRSIAMPPIEWPTRLKRSNPNASASASASAAISSIECSPAASRMPP
ncbi:hypothetical protein LMG26840_05200 [Achromobacter dolens]|nr:hypothetical protein LMG26840_05200 [Achromobacter dolens]